MSKVEEVARALAASDGAKFETNPNVYTTLARAAIEVIAPSIRDIILAAEPYAGPYVHDIIREIDAALEEGK